MDDREIAEHLTDKVFDPTREVDPDTEQFFRVNAAAFKDQLPRYIAHVMREAYAAGAGLPNDMKAPPPGDRWPTGLLGI